MTDTPEDRPFSLVQAIGVLIALASLVVAVAPQLVQDFDPTSDLFEATERHARWGLGVAVGAMLVVNQWRQSWSVTLAWAALCLSGGYLVATLIGMVIEGPSDVPHWVLVGVELVICGVAYAWIRYRYESPYQS